MVQAELKSLKADLTNLSDNSFRSRSSQNSPRNKSYFSSTPQRQQNSSVSSPSPVFVPKKVNYFSRPVHTAPRSTQTALSKSNNSKRNVCFYHSCFGANARNCSKGCEFFSPGTTSSTGAKPNDVAFCCIANMHFWSVFDSISNRNFVIDTGSCRSLIAANNRERSSPPQSRLKAANGTDILAYGEKPVTLQIGNPPRIVTYLHFSSD